MGEQQPVADPAARADHLAVIPDLLLHAVQRVIGQGGLRLPARDHHRGIPGAAEGGAVPARAIDALMRDLHPPRGGPHAAAHGQRLEKGDLQVERELRLRRAGRVAGQIGDQRRKIGRSGSRALAPLAQRGNDAGARVGGCIVRVGRNLGMHVHAAPPKLALGRTNRGAAEARPTGRPSLCEEAKAHGRAPPGV